MSRIILCSEPGFAGVKRHVVDVLGSDLVVRPGRALGLVYSFARADATFAEEVSLIERRGVECWRVDMAGQVRPWQDLRSLFKLIGLLARTKPDLLHLHSSKAGALGRLAAFLVCPSTFIIYTPHAMAAFRSRLFLLIERILAEATDVLLAVSISEREDFGRWGVGRRSRHARIRLGLDGDYPNHPIAEEVGRAMPKIVACGRICRQKNALLFFEVARLCGQKGAPFRFVWIGDYGEDEEASAVKALMEQGEMAPVRITGWLKSVEPELADADVFCMFSRYESFGYVTAEAMAMGLPVLATPASGTNDLVRDGETGRMCAPSSEEIFRALCSYLDNPADWREMAERGRRFVTLNHSKEAMASDVDGLYASIESMASAVVL